ncbi:5-oxoprolinase subunit PxpB [Flavisolibacter nicotianae]|uniref:5-oxoprolinase subunit PxpB n=1 Tax=Flavisolibacter nicotianae TaxID=2364882 RepID=UPI000EB01441|nr:5-oxoprolinase subunit PxpB [Flavisolibacter nicotianae]
MHPAFTITPLGDGALVISFGNVMEEEINENVLQLFHCLQNTPLPFTDIVPAYSSLTFFYDVHSWRTKEATAFEKVKEALLPFLQQTVQEKEKSGQTIAIPVCYARVFAPDLEELAAQKALSAEEVIGLHTAKTYRVYMIGFLPGFPYMGKVDSRLATPRKSSPRTAIPAGSVGIAGEQTGIYPFTSPGGWNIIGRTPLRLFDKDRSEPTLLQPGDSVTFYPISEDAFENYQSRIA